MKWLWFEFLFLFFLKEVSSSDDNSGDQSASDIPEYVTTPALLTKQELKTLPIKKLKLMLEERNVKCLGCNEKEHYIDRAYETQNLPIVEKKTTTPPKNDGGKSNQDKENIEEVLEQLKKGGFGNTKVFTADDMKNFNPDDFAQQFNEPKRSRRSSSSKKKKEKEPEVDFEL
jgi:hypothetical protein